MDYVHLFLFVIRHLLLNANYSYYCNLIRLIESIDLFNFDVVLKRFLAKIVQYTTVFRRRTRDKMLYDENDGRIKRRNAFYVIARVLEH